MPRQNAIHTLKPPDQDQTIAPLPSSNSSQFSQHPRPQTAREAAFVALQEWFDHGDFLAATLDRIFKDAAPQERRLARELSFGVVRRIATIDAILAPHVARPREKVEDSLWMLLRLGAYQIVFLDGIPSHAAVHETVELARRLGQPRWCGFANAVLRRVVDAATSDTVEAPANDSVPLASGRYRRLNVPAFPDPSFNRSAWLASAFSLPRWLVDRWSPRFSPDELVSLGFWFNAPSHVWLRTNTCKTTRDALLTSLANAGVDAAPGSRPESICLVGAVAVETLPGYAEGLFVVQDESAMAAAPLLDPQPGDSVLDLCAAPGGKTTHLAERMQNRGRIVAVDVSPDRLQRVPQNVARLGVSIVETRTIHEDGSDIPAGPFDAVLLDVPCSNTGVLGRRPEARWRLEPKDIHELSVIQRRLLDAACRRVKPGGRIVYSTCSIEDEENGDLVRDALQRHPAFKLVKEVRHFPGQPVDGGYMALIRRSS